ncbi:MAG: hypothetical protein IT245_06230, partial [Bacteroidia bacterium]|nr:hypothetical protein [Bacteroidia bacterium]
MRLISLFVASLMMLQLNAQKYGISIESGPSFGLLKKDLTDAAFQSSTSYSMGSGISNGLQFQYYPDSSNWYFSTGLELFQSNQITTAEKTLDS